MGQTSPAPVGLSPPPLGRNPHCNDGAVGKGGWKSWLLHLSDATPLTTEGQSGDPGWLPAVQGGVLVGKKTFPSWPGMIRTSVLVALPWSLGIWVLRCVWVEAGCPLELLRAACWADHPARLQWGRLLLLQPSGPTLLWLAWGSPMALPAWCSSGISLSVAFCALNFPFWFA